jgi:hypothetical protein
MRLTRIIATFGCSLFAACSSGFGSTIPSVPDGGSPGRSAAVIRSFQPGPAERADYEISFNNGSHGRVHNVSLSRVRDVSGDWISIQGKDFDWQYRPSIVSKISRSAGATATQLAIDSIPLRANRSLPVGKNPNLCPPQAFADPQIPRTSSNPCNGSCNFDPLCGGADFGAWGRCYSSTVCGQNSDGTGIGYEIINGTGDLECIFSFVDNGVECSAASTNDVTQPADLFAQFRLNFTDAYLDCHNPVNQGYATATYSDDRQRGGAKKGHIPGGPGLNTWDFPVDFAPFFFGQIYPPVQPIRMAATYYKFGAGMERRDYAQGFCKYPHV